MPSPLDDPETTTPAEQEDNASTVEQDQPAKPLAIESPEDVQRRQKDAESDKVHTLDVGEGNVVKLDALGPMIINSDGTLSRIQNWHELTPGEQERTVRLLVKKRNVVRLQKLEAEERDGEVGGAGNGAGEERLTALREGCRE